jgi:hypothetical protein
VMEIKLFVSGALRQPGKEGVFVQCNVMLSIQGSFVCPRLKHACNGLASPSDPAPMGDRFCFPRALSQPAPENHRHDLQLAVWTKSRLLTSCLPAFKSSGSEKHTYQCHLSVARGFEKVLSFDNRRGNRVTMWAWKGKRDR